MHAKNEEKALKKMKISQNKHILFKIQTKNELE
jgi:hypothetical protein